MKISAKHNGVALILVLWILAFLSVLALSASLDSNAGFRRGEMYRENAQTYYLALSGLEQSFDLMHDGTSFIIAGNGEIIPLEPGAEEGELVFRKYPMGNGWFEVRFFDEESRVNINNPKLATLPVLERLLEYSAGMPKGAERTALANSILDWIDTDDEARIGGAENDYYRNKAGSYPCANGPVLSVADLLRVKGMTGDILYGFRDSDGKEYPGLASCLGVFGERVNPNTATKLVRKAYFPENTLQVKGNSTTTVPRYLRIVSTGYLNNSGAKHSVCAVYRWRSGVLDIVSWDDNYVEITR